MKVDKFKTLWEAIRRPIYLDQIGIGNYAAKASILVIMIMPLGVLFRPGVSLMRIMSEPESRGMSTLFLLFTYALHVPVFIMLVTFSHAMRKCKFREVAMVYLTALAGLALSSIYYSSTVFTRPTWMGYIPALVYFGVLVPLLSQGVFGALKRELAAKSSEAALEAEGGDPVEALVSRAKAEKLRIIFNLIVDRATMIGGEKGLRILKAAMENPYQVQEALGHARDSYQRLKAAMTPK